MVLMMADQDDNRNQNARLNAVIALLIENMVVSGLISKARAIEILYVSGMTPTEIGRIFEQPPGNISSIIGKLRKQKRHHGKSIG